MDRIACLQDLGRKKFHRHYDRRADRRGNGINLSEGEQFTATSTD
jgi:hypothetical protein